MAYSLEFRAWNGSKDDVDYDETPDFFDAKFENIQEAKSKIYNDCIQWPIDGENEYLTISFKFGPKIFDADGKCVSKCEIIDLEDMEFEWIDL
jgi:hypothetical protein